MFFDKLVPSARPNRRWDRLRESGALTLRAEPLIAPTDKVFTIGSCFAEEIRKALTAAGVACLPAYRLLRFDTGRLRVDDLPAREHMNYYNTFSIRQELERAAGLWTQDPDDVWTLPGRVLRGGVPVAGEGTLYQDPYRRFVFAPSKEELRDVVRQIDAVMADGLREADAVFVTLGMTEVFRKKDNGLVCNEFPTYAGAAGFDETEHRSSTFQENLDNVRASIRLVRTLNPRARVVLTVSPVPISRSFGADDVYVTNCASKSTLRAVANEACREFPDVAYFPAYEIVTGFGRAAYLEEDLVHVRAEVASLIVYKFLQAHCGAPARPAAETAQ